MNIPTPADLRTRRKDLGLTQREVADAAGVSQPLIARIEGGSVDPRLSTVRAIVEALDAAEATIVRAGELMNEPVVTVEADTTVSNAVRTMDEAAFSQLPVVENGVAIGSISVSDLTGLEDAAGSDPVSQHMAEPFPTVSPNATDAEIASLLEHAQGVLVVEQGRPLGIVTEADLAARLSSSNN